MTNIHSKIKKKVYESKKARDLLDEEFTEFLPIKKSTDEFFNIYNSKFYNISIETHDMFSQKSLDYIIYYINPKELILNSLKDQLIDIQDEIDSIELFHPIYPNSTVLKLKNDIAKWLIQSGKTRKISNKDSDALYKEIKIRQKSTKKPDSEFWIEVDSGISGIPSSKPIETKEDLLDPISIINTYTGP